MSSERRFESWWRGAAGFGWAAAVGMLLLSWNRLPEPLASHFGSSGAPDGSLSKAGFLVLLTGQVLLAVLVSAPRNSAAVSSRVAGAAGRLALVGFMSTLAATASAFTIGHNWGRSTWAEAGPIGPLSVLAMIAPALVISGALFALGRRWWPPPSSGPAALLDALPLGEGERAYWTGSASNGWLLVIGVGALLEGALLYFVLSTVHAPPVVLLVVHVLVLALLELFSKIRVTVDERALTIVYGRLGWFRQRIPIERIAGATAFELEPWDHGGWGYRGSLRLARRAAVVVRSGAAVRLDLREGKQLAITVDDAATAARLINGFVRRRAAPPLAPAADLSGLGA